MSDETFRLPNGRHQGELITRVPVSYLTWMVSEGHTHATEALAELRRRGTVLPTVEITNHAIDRASLRCLDLWRSTRRQNEGIAAWLHRAARKALDQGESMELGKVRFAGMQFTFKDAVSSEAWPVLLTVNRHGGKYVARKRAQHDLREDVDYGTGT